MGTILVLQVLPWYYLDTILVLWVLPWYYLGTTLVLWVLPWYYGYYLGTTLVLWVLPGCYGYYLGTSLVPSQYYVLEVQSPNQSANGRFNQIIHSTIGWLDIFINFPNNHLPIHHLLEWSIGILSPLDDSANLSIEPCFGSLNIYNVQGMFTTGNRES